MTISIKIVNADSRETAVVAVKVQSPGGPATEWNPPIRLKGGEGIDTYVHSGQQLIVEEIQNG